MNRKNGSRWCQLYKVFPLHFLHFLNFCFFCPGRPDSTKTHFFGWNGWVHPFYLEATLSKIFSKSEVGHPFDFIFEEPWPTFILFLRGLRSPRVTQGLCPSEVQCPRDVPVRKSYLFRWPNVQALSSLMAWEDFEACDFCAQIETYPGSESGTIQLPPGKSNL